MIDKKPRRLVRSFHAAAKPIGSRCNIDCTYCYYLHKQGLLNDTTASPMSDYHNQVRGEKAIEYWIVKTRKRRSA